MTSVLFNAIEGPAYEALDYGIVPDFLIRRGIRLLLRQRLNEIKSQSIEQSVEHKWQYIQDLKERQVAIETDKANEQHYEVSTAFIEACLGKRMKYSCCLYPTGKETLDEAEELMLDSYCTKARLQDGMDILDLGCGWGSLSLYLAERYPESRITSLSNSTTQKVHIDAQAALKGLTNIQVFTGDVKTFDFAGTRSFDRIISIEMFEHMKNYEALLQKVSTWLRPNAESKYGESLLFIHIFCHKTTPYHFEDGDGWMSKHFFSGGTMPSLDLFTFFQRDLVLERHWWINGKHYARTCEDWLKKQDSTKSRWIGTHNEAQLVSGKGDKEARATEGRKTFFRFRVFYLACAELFDMNGGEEWGVGHYLFRKQ